MTLEFGNKLLTFFTLVLFLGSLANPPPSPKAPFFPLTIPAEGPENFFKGLFYNFLSQTVLDPKKPLFVRLGANKQLFYFLGAKKLKKNTNPG